MLAHEHARRARVVEVDVREEEMTHASTADAPFAAPKKLVRLSVGIESVDDLLADLEAALVRAHAAA